MSEVLRGLLTIAIISYFTESTLIIAFNTYLSFAPFTKVMLHAEIHPVRTWAKLSLISFEVAGIMAVMNCDEPAHMPGSDGIPPALFRIAGPDPSLLLLNLSLLSMPRATFPTK